MKPIFRQRHQVLEYEALLILKSVTLPSLVDLKIKKNSILGTISLKLGKLMLCLLTKQSQTLRTDVGTDTRMRLLQAVDVLCEPLKYYQSQSVLPFGIRKSDID